MIEPVAEAQLVTGTTAPTALPDTTILAGQLAPASIARYRRDVSAYITWAAASDLNSSTSSTLARWIAYLAQETQLSPNSINRMIYAVKRLAREAAAQGFLGADAAASFQRVSGIRVRALRGRQKGHARTRIEPADMRRLCMAPDSTTLKGKRDRALLVTLASSGVRISELVGLRGADIVARNNGWLLQVLGKTDLTPRDAPLSPEARELILIWLAARPIASEYVFTGFGGRGGRANAKPIAIASAWQVVQDYATACGLAHIKPHDFRRFVGTQLAAQDIRKAQKALGHKSIETTARHYVLDSLETGLTDNLF